MTLSLVIHYSFYPPLSLPISSPASSPLSLSPLSKSEPGLEESWSLSHRSPQSLMTTSFEVDPLEDPTASICFTTVS